MATRAEFLGRVRAEVARARPAAPFHPTPRPARPAEAADLVRRQMLERWPEALARFQLEFERVGGVLHRVATRAEVPGVVAAIARERGARELVTWTAAALGIDLAGPLGAAGLGVSPAPAGAGEAERVAHRAAAAAAGVGVTGTDWAIAETGSLVLVSGAGRPRTTSLLPETHVAVFGPGQLVESLEQVGVMLEALHVDGGARLSGAMVNVITGPSRTADIELTLTRGVHGPREVHAIFVDEGAG
jgi:L-lactate dehydrogenase complex protein LldG